MTENDLAMMALAGEQLCDECNYRVGVIRSGAIGWLRCIECERDYCGGGGILDPEDWIEVEEYDFDKCLEALPARFADALEGWM